MSSQLPLEVNTSMDLVSRGMQERFQFRETSLIKTSARAKSKIEELESAMTRPRPEVYRSDGSVDSATLITVNDSKVACSKAKKEILKLIKDIDKETALMNRMSRFCEHEDARSLIGSVIPPTLQQGMQVCQMWVNFETSTTVPPKVTASIYTLLKTRDESVDAGDAAQSSSYARLSSRPTRPIAFKIELELQKGTMDWHVMPASRATAWSTTETGKPSWIRL